MPSTLLAVENVCMGYGLIEVLHGLSLEVCKGEIVTIIGANGAGKTSTLLSICNIHPIRSGQVTFEGQVINNLPAHRLVELGIAQVPEGRKIFPRLTVLENLQLGAYTRSDSAEIREDFEKMFLLFPVLRDRRNQSGGTLSGGEQQMLAIARALMSRPTLLLLDEPSMGVAPLLVAKIFETIQVLNKDGLSVLLVEQNAHLALRISHRGYVLESGRICLQDNAAALLTNEKVKEAYLGA